MGTYEKGHIKRNTLTNEVAIRTVFPEDQGLQLSGMAWLIGTVSTGARSAKTEEVEEDGWVDIYTPPVEDYTDVYADDPVEAEVVEP
jgi:hypothetical protein